MADNVAITAGVGTTVATDDVGGAHYQEIKLVDGTKDSNTPIAVDIGVKANALRVAPANNITDETYIGDIKFGEAEPNSAAIKTALELLDNAVDGNYLNVNCNIAGVDFVGGAGAVAAGVQRVTLASDDPAVVDLAAIEVLQTTIAGDTTSIDGKITACNTGAVVLAAGSAAIGKLAANSGVDIGDVDILSIAAGDNNIGNVDIVTVPAPLNVVGGGAEATALRVTLANDSTGVVSVDDNDGALTVDGTVTASNAAGDVAHDSVDSGNPVKVGGKSVNMDGTTPGTAVAEADRTNFITDLYGRQCVETVHPCFWSATVNYSEAQTATEIKATPGAGLSLYITDIIISNGATAGNIKFVENTGTPADVVEVLYFAANSGVPIHLKTPIKLTANVNFGITSVTCTTHSILVCGYIAP